MHELEYFHTDLFRALLDERNRYPGYREHPVFLALLYAFCPVAARWWISGADPVMPYDVVWDAVQDFATGMSLKDAIEKRDLRDLHGHVKKYIKSVETYRNNPTTNYRGSELSPTFTGEEIEVTARAGYQAAFDKYFGGNWRNVLKFVRTWAFTIPDWRGDSGIQPGKSEYTFEAVSVAFSVPRLNWRTIEWPAWVWRVKNGYALRIVLGAMVNDGLQDELRFALFTRSPGYFVDVSEEDKIKRRVAPWEVIPHVYSFERQVGQARPLNARFDVERLVSLIPAIATVSAKGACSPMGALVNYKKCEQCGFRALCYTPDGDITPIVYEGMRGDAEKFDRSIQ